MAYDWKTDVPGVFSRHVDECPVREGGECICGPLGYRSSVRDWETSRRSVSPMYETLVEALAWQRDQIVTQDASQGIALDRGELGALIDEYLQAVENGLAGGRNGRENARALRGALSYVDSELGTMDVQDVRRRHIQGLVDQLRSSGLADARIHSVVDALQALYGYAVQRELVGFSPVVELVLPGSSNGAIDANHYPDPTPHGWTSGEPWTAPPPVGAPWTPPPYTPPGVSQPPFAAPPQPQPQRQPYGQADYATEGYAPQPQPPSRYAPTGFTSDGFAPPPQQPPWHAPSGYRPDGFTPPHPYTPPDWTGYQSAGPFSAPGAPTQPSAQAQYDATMQERWLWWTVRIVVIVFVLIALVLAAESV